MKKGYVYILVLKDQSMFKIGKSINMLSRLQGFHSSWGEFDLDKSFLIYTDEKYLLRIEKYLHDYFAQYNIENLTQKEGYTEFFDICILSEVIQLCEKFINDSEKLSTGDLTKLKKDYQKQKSGKGRPLKAIKATSVNRGVKIGSMKAA